MQRASEHAANLQVEIRAFLDTNPYKVSHEFDRKALPNEFPPGTSVVAVHRYRVEISAPVPSRISILAGDVLKDLRSALDYVAWQLALAESDDPTPTTAFPIFSNGARYRNDHARFIGGINPAIHPIFESVQPYHAGDDAFKHPLWVLHRLANDDKHRMPHVVGSIPVAIGLTRRPGMDFSVWTTIGPFEEGDVVATVGIIKDPTPETEPEIETTFDVAFGKDTPAWSVQGLFAEIDRIGSEVEAVIRRFEPFFPRRI